MKIKKTVVYNALTIKLYEIDWKEVGSKTIPNIEAYHTNGNLAWTVEPPTFGFHYYDMQMMKMRTNWKLIAGRDGFT